jgi:hypothetical protein
MNAARENHLALGFERCRLRIIYWRESCARRYSACDTKLDLPPGSAE